MLRLLRMFPVSRLFRMFPIWICEGRRLSMFLGFNPANAGIRVDRHMHLRTCLESDLILSVQPTFELVVESSESSLMFLFAISTLRSHSPAHTH